MLAYLVTFLLSMTPVIELRGAIPVGVGMGLSYFTAFIVAFIGNILPVYFIVKYADPIFNFLGKIKPIGKILDWFKEKTTKKIQKNEKLQTSVALGLFVLVAIPLPGTGAWTGSLAANLLGVKVKKAIVPIILGVLVAGIIVLAVTAAACGGISAIFDANVNVVK